MRAGNVGAPMKLARSLASPLIAAAALLVAQSAAAQTIYPLTRAEILAGSKFDFKVEFEGAPAAADIKVTINGRDAAQVLGKSPSVEANEEGQGHAAYWLRNVSLTQPGAYEVVASAAGKSQTVTWKVFGTPPRRAPNVILFIGDGMSVAHRTAARVLSKGLAEGRYGGELAIDDMPAMALVSTSGTNYIITDSANSMSTYTTGHKSCNNALGVYCARNKDGLAHPRVETIAELVKRRHGGLRVGVVTNTEIEDATPAGMVAHVRRRRDYDAIVRMFFDVKPDVMMGGGSGFFLPKSDDAGRRKDEETISRIQGGRLSGCGHRDGNEVGGCRQGNEPSPRPVPCRQPRRRARSQRAQEGHGAEVSRSARPCRSDAGGDRHSLKGPNGFVLMVESGLIDKYHALDWERAVYDTIMLDNAVAVAKRFAAQRDDTLIVVVADHAHPVSIIGTYDDQRPGESLREELGIYGEAKNSPTIPQPLRTATPNRSM